MFKKTRLRANFGRQPSLTAFVPRASTFAKATADKSAGKPAVPVDRRSRLRPAGFGEAGSSFSSILWSCFQLSISSRQIATGT
jgi:hypothetical protein